MFTGLGELLLGGAAMLTAVASAVANRRRTNSNTRELRALRSQLQRVFAAIAACTPATRTELTAKLDSELLEEIAEANRQTGRPHQGGRR